MRLLQPRTLRELAERKGQNNSPVLSLYLNLDPANTVSRRGGYKVALDGMLKEIENQIENDEQLRHFQEDAEWVRQKAEFHLPKGKSLVLFCDVSDAFYFEENLPIRMANQAWFGKTPYVRPFLEAWEEHARYGVVLADREKARFFVIAMGEIHEVSDIFQEPPVKHRSAAGSDHMRSQMVLQRRADKYSEEFLKSVVDRLQEILEEYHLDKIVLAGPDEVTAELYRLLPKAVLLRVCDRVKISVNAKASEVFELSGPAIEKIEREQERQMVHDLVTMAHKTQGPSAKAVIGFNATLSAANQGRIYRLVYATGSKVPGYQCPACDVLLDHPPADLTCPYCCKPLEEHDDLVWPLSERVLTTGGRVEEIRDPEARLELAAAGQIGAYLR